MGRPKGYPKSGGRKPGSLNKRTRIVDELLKNSKNPFEVLVELMNSDNESIRLQAAKELAQYERPKKKAIEHSGEIRRPTLEIVGPDDKGVRISYDEHDDDSIKN